MKVLVKTIETPTNNACSLRVAHPCTPIDTLTHVQKCHLMVLEMGENFFLMLQNPC